MHPGSGSIQVVIDSLNAIAPEWPSSVRLLLENTAGQGKYVGSTIKELQMIIDYISHPMPLGICYDTAHAWGAGSNIGDDVNHPMIKLVHLNDSLVSHGSRKDRHANLGHGTMPGDLFQWLAETIEVPIIMETPEILAVQDLNYFKSLLK